MVIGIDAGNTRTGGGLTYLREMLRAAEPRDVGIDRVVVWGNSSALAQLPQESWLKSVHQPAHDQAFYRGFFWQRKEMTGEAQRERCSLLYFPGSTYVGDFRPYVAMSQNMLPFSPRERQRYGFGWMRVRLKLLEYAQTRTFGRASAMLFLTQWAKLGIEGSVRRQYSRFKIVPHGISERFRRESVDFKPLSAYSFERPFRWLYVSIVAPYKHQWNVAAAAAKLRGRGLPVAVDFVGPAYELSLQRLRQSLAKYDQSEVFLKYHGAVPYGDLHHFYHRSDGFIFASSCENLPNILIEAMSAHLPIACSNAGPMPEVLGDGGLYFDPEDIDSIAAVMERMMRDCAQRSISAATAAVRARKYSWKRCANETFSFLAEVAKAK